MDAGCCSQKSPLPQHSAVQHARLAGTKLDLASTHGNSSTHDVIYSKTKLQNDTDVENISLAERQVWKQFAPRKKHGG